MEAVGANHHALAITPPVAAAAASCCRLRQQPKLGTRRRAMRQAQQMFNALTRAGRSGFAGCWAWR